MAKKKKKSSGLRPSALIGIVVILFVFVLSVAYMLTSNNGDLNETTQESDTTDEQTQEIESSSTELLEQSTETTTETTTIETTTVVPTTSSEIETLPVPVAVIIQDTGWETTLVNIYYKMPDNYSVSLAPCIEGSDIKLDYRVAPFYEAMYIAAKAEGCVLTPYSGYRSFERQANNYNRKTQSYMDQGYSSVQALTLAANSIMPPGCSEHNLGFAMDIAGTNTSFDQTKEFEWLLENAAEYGFILRYPKDKTHITKVKYEPWHWRYVGVEAAKEIKISGNCLEEYLNKLPEN